MEDDTNLITERLLLRPLKLSDAADLYFVFSNPLAMRFWDTPPHTSTADTQATIEGLLTEKACWWSLCAPENGQAIGYVGYLGNQGVPGMGYILHPDYWRQGYMTEAVQAALDYGFSHLELDRVELWINDDNIASQKLAQKIGFTRRGRFRMKYAHQAEAHDKWVYGLYRHEWQTTPGTSPDRPQQCYSLQPVLSVSDVQGTATFYRDQLGFTIDFFYGDPPVHGGVSCGDWTTEGARIQLSQGDNVEPAKAGVRLSIVVGPDIDARYEHYQARGVSIVREIASYPWGMREFDVEDCNGYVLRFGTPV